MIQRVQIAIRGAVQGVGFRPFIYRLAREHRLNGFVNNNSAGVLIEAEGEEHLLLKFLAQIEKDKPQLSVITSLEYSIHDPVGYEDFQIAKSEETEQTTALILPDIAVCNDCLYELFDPADRRYRYPFINCTNCGPRFSIIESLPYDRPNTSMKTFEMCDKCSEEYADPENRRYHAQPIACPKCGPQIELWDYEGKVICRKEAALQKSVNLINEGKIIALKGIGGFQLIADALNNDSVYTLRKRKHRQEKPFALMFPDFNRIKDVCDVSAAEERIIKSPESPIVLLKRKSGLTNVSDLVAPGNPYLGAMLPYTPLHHLLTRMMNSPLIATSANLAEEPICIDENEALGRLNGIADYFLIHNRPVVRHVDDSIVRVVMNRKMILRRARGYAPLPISLNEKQNNRCDNSILAVGGHLKNTVALRKDKSIFVSQHIGDLSTIEANNTFKNVIADFKDLYNTEPDVVICDKHPDYVSTKYAESLRNKPHYIQHHYAHAAACRLENQVEGDALCISWDGTGYGSDGSAWGGEFFISDEHSYEHIAQFKQFLLPGGNAAIKEPRRSLTGILYEIAGNSFADQFTDLLRNKFTAKELKIITNILTNKVNSPKTSSAGRLFDAVSSLINICQKSSYEGHGAMMLEFSADENEPGIYPFDIPHRKEFINWKPMYECMIKDVRKKISPGKISAKFHNTMAEIILTIARGLDVNKVMLSGGCFQNALLTEKTITVLQQNNYKVYWHQRIPPNDGGISLGQVAAFIYGSKNEKVKKIINPKRYLSKEVH